MKIYLKSIPFSTIRAGALIIMASVFLNRSIAKKYFIFLLFSLPFSSRIHAQNAPALEWQKSLGGSSDDRAESIQLTNDGGFITAGSSESIDGDISGNHGKNDFWVVKLDSALNILWQKSLAGVRMIGRIPFSKLSAVGILLRANLLPATAMFRIIIPIGKDILQPIIGSFD
jgi:hypothetical protein